MLYVIESRTPYNTTKKVRSRISERKPCFNVLSLFSIHRCIQEGRKRKNVGTLSFFTGRDCWGNAWLKASNRIEDDGYCVRMVVDATSFVIALLSPLTETGGHRSHACVTVVRCVGVVSMTIVYEFREA